MGDAGLRAGVGSLVACVGTVVRGPTKAATPVLVSVGHMVANEFFQNKQFG